MYLIMSLVLPKPTGKVSVMLSLSHDVSHEFSYVRSIPILSPENVRDAHEGVIHNNTEVVHGHASAFTTRICTCSGWSGYEQRSGPFWRTMTKSPPRSSEFQMTSAELTPHVSVTVPTRIDGLWGFATLRLSLLDSLYICTQLPANIYIESWSDNPSFCEATAANTTAQWEVMQGVCQ